MSQRSGRNFDLRVSFGYNRDALEKASTMSNQPCIPVLYWIFALSGFSGLIYESIWSRYLGLFLGHAAYAQSLVLIIFMGGMATGAAACSRWSGRWKNLLRAYALIEGLVGVLALFFHEVFQITLTNFFDHFIPRMASAEAITISKWSAAALLILPQSILLGMTFPLMSGGVIRRFPDRPGWTLAMLYFTNSIGGVLGVLAGGFWLIQTAGLPGTMRVAGLINVSLALVVWWIGKAPEQPFAPVLDREAAHSQDYRLLLVVALLTGVASFIYEVAWIRMLSMVLGSSTHSFELMLSAFILGLALGGLWIRRRIDRIPDPTRWLALVQVVMGILALSTLLVYGSTFTVMRWLLDATPKSDLGYLLFNISSHAIAMFIMLPTTFCAGMTLPLITYVLLRKGFGERTIGVVYSANTVGAIIGVVFAVHVGMPILGLKNLLVSGAAIDIALGIMLLAMSWNGNGARLAFGSSSAAFVAVLATVIWVHLDPYSMASGVFRRAQSRLDFEAGDLVLSHADGKTATVSIVWQSTGLSIRTNGKIDAMLNRDSAKAPSSDEATMVLAGGLPILLHPGAKTAANIGMGSGLTSQILLTTPLLSRVDTVEIEQAMVDGARHFRPRNELVFTDPRSRIYIEDAKTFFSSHRKKYDIIVSEPSNPWVSGVAGLFSSEFYSLIARHLEQRGILVQWLQLYEIDMPLVASVFKALSQHFGDFHVYAANNSDILVVARVWGEIPNPDANLLLTHADFAAELHRIGVASTDDVFIRKIADKAVLRDWINGALVVPNSDYYPKLDLGAERARFLNLNARALLFMREVPLPFLDILAGAKSSKRNATITPNRNLRLSGQAFGASRIRDHILGRAVATVPRDGSVTEQQVQRALKECFRNKSTSDGVNLLFKIGFEMVPYIRLDAPKEFWHRFRALPCAQNLGKEEIVWLDLFMAIDSRNSVAMAQIAERLLNSGVNLKHKDYLLALAMLARKADGNHHQAHLLSKQYRTHNKISSEWAFLLDLILANSGHP